MFANFVEGRAVLLGIQFGLVAEVAANNSVKITKLSKSLSNLRKQIDSNYLEFETVSDEYEKANRL